MVYNVPTFQYVDGYVFFVEPTYPEGHIVVIRKKKSGAFHDVTLDCAGKLRDWTDLGDYSWTRVSMGPGADGSCTPGPHQIRSDAPFGLTVWGWGHDPVSYGFPAGMSVASSHVTPPSVPR